MPEAVESEVMLLLSIEHLNIDRVLDVLEQELARISDGAACDTILLKDIANYFVSFPDKCHHPKEDLILDRVLQAVPEKGELLGHLKDEHEQVASMTRRLADIVDRLQPDTDVALPALIKFGGEFVELYREHMHSEQTVFFPQASLVLTDEDWLNIDFRIFDELDPVFGEAAEEEFRLLRDKIVDKSASRG